MTALGDRRAAIRLEVVGVLRAHVDDGTRVRVLNLSTRGALIASPQLLHVDATGTLSLTVGGHELHLPMRARHVSMRGGGARREYAVGVEFLGRSIELEEALARPTRRRIRRRSEKSTNS